VSQSDNLEVAEEADVYAEDVVMEAVSDDDADDESEFQDILREDPNGLSPDQIKKDLHMLNTHYNSVCLNVVVCVCVCGGVFFFLLCLICFSCVCFGVCMCLSLPIMCPCMCMCVCECVCVCVCLCVCVKVCADKRRTQLR